MLCNRTSPYTIPIEFRRAISLIHQRLIDIKPSSLYGSDIDDAKTLSTSIDAIYNCLDIKYASNDDELGEAEGVFKFIQGGNPDRLEILVKPKYENTDDLLTGLLLIHEITHAWRYAYDTYNRELGWDNDTDCFENEAKAFNNEYLFYKTMTDEEKNSLLSRNQSYFSAVNTFMTQMQTIAQAEGNGYYQKALMYVSTNPFYQNQCK